MVYNVNYVKQRLPTLTGIRIRSVVLFNENVFSHDIVLTCTIKVVKGLSFWSKFARAYNVWQRCDTGCI